MARWPRPSNAPGDALPVSIADCDPRRIEAGAGPHVTRMPVVHDQHADRPIGLGLQDEAAFLDRRAEHDGQDDGLPEQLRHRLRIVVAGQNFVDRRPKPHHPPAQVERSDFERQHGVVGRGVGRRTHRDSGVRIGVFIAALCNVRHTRKTTPAHRQGCWRDHQLIAWRHAGTRPECLSGRAGDSPPRRTRPIAGRP